MSAVLVDCPVALRAQTTIETRTLHRACEMVGGLPQLAALLEVSPAVVTRWLKGEEKMPKRVFLTAVDLVLAGPGEAPSAIQPPAEPGA